MPIKDISIKGPQLFIAKYPYSKFCILMFQYFNPSVVFKAVSHFTFYYRCMCLCFRVSLY